MKGVEKYFVFDFPAALARLARCFRHADNDFAGKDFAVGIQFQRKGQDVRRAGDAEEFLVQFRHSFIADQCDRKLVQCRLQNLMRGGNLLANEASVLLAGCGVDG
jgi:hypothetical protein